MPKLVLIANGESREIVMEQELTIGRGYSNLLRLDGDEISRVHAIIYRRGEDFILRDLDSKNGILVNGHKVSMTELAPGDRLQVGKHCLIFDPKEPAAPTYKPSAGLANDDPTPDFARPSPAFTPSAPDYEHSHLFSAPTPHSGKAGVVTPGVDEEILLLTRQQLTNYLHEKEALAADQPSPAANGSGANNRPGADLQVVSNLLDLASDEAYASSHSFSETVLRALVRGAEASRGAVILQKSDEGLVPLAIYPSGADVAVNRVVLREAFSEGRAVLCPVTRECGLFRDSSTIMRNNITTLISVPLRGAAGEQGLLYLDRRGDESGFSLAHLLIATRIGRLLEMALFYPTSQATSSPQVVM